MRTHYDNLKVRSDAPVGDIKSSYRKLSQKYHPDRNPDPAALEIMKLINLAWDVLGDPDRRARHDRAIAALERRQSPARRATAPASPARDAPPERAGNWPDGDALRVAVVLGLLLVALFVATFQFAANQGDGEIPVALAEAEPDRMPSGAAPEDRERHGYLVASAQDNSPGIATVDIDNTAGGHDAEVRLFLDDRSARAMFVHHGKRFVVESLAPGKYVVKYRILINGKVRAFQERAVFQPRRGEFSKLKLKVPVLEGDNPTADEIAADLF